MSEYCPLVTCRLTDRLGNLINPYTPGSIVYTDPIKHFDNQWSVAIEGYIAVYSDNERISPPIPFCIVSPFCLSVPKSNSISFQLKSFKTWAFTCKDKCNPKEEYFKLLISIKTIVYSRKATTILVPKVNSDLDIIDRVCIYTDQICCSKRVDSNCCIYYKNAILQAKISQYNAIADGTKRTFLNSDELKEYGGDGIISPAKVSYCKVFVNGLLQPKKNYILKKGRLTFTTNDIPSKDQPVIIQFIKWKGFNDKKMNVRQWQFSAVSDGNKKVYTNVDELPEYKSRGIPSPCEVSYFNLYINGVLQPKTNYRVKKGRLKLTTKNAPTDGAFVILECIAIKDQKSRLFRADTSAYNTYSNEKKVYTNKDEILMYGKDGIICPNESSCQNLFINGVIQPPVNYIVKKGYLILQTDDSPTVKSPITLQSVTSTPTQACCKTQFSDTALAKWKKEYLNEDNFAVEKRHNQ